MGKESKREFQERIKKEESIEQGKGGISAFDNALKQFNKTAGLLKLMPNQIAMIKLPRKIVDPSRLSQAELERLSRRYFADLIECFGPDKDIPAPDVNTNPQIMGWFMDTYSMHHREYTPAA